MVYVGERVARILFGVHIAEQEDVGEIVAILLALERKLAFGFKVTRQLAVERAVGTAVLPCLTDVADVEEAVLAHMYRPAAIRIDVLVFVWPGHVLIGIGNGEDLRGEIAARGHLPDGVVACHLALGLLFQIEAIGRARADQRQAAVVGVDRQHRHRLGGGGAGRQEEQIRGIEGCILLVIGVAIAADGVHAGPVVVLRLTPHRLIAGLGGDSGQNGLLNYAAAPAGLHH